MIVKTGFLNRKYSSSFLPPKSTISIPAKSCVPQEIYLLDGLVCGFIVYCFC